ncbi:hypothetical protein V7968_26270 [Nocardia vulneris]|uniref:hypothetical protein n=1 Tax=Nocardia vulneris TaxID=1141657 RepID=UPI0030D02B9F
MDSGEKTDSAEPSRAVTGWTVALICVAIVASGVIVGGLLHEREPEPTTAPVPASSTEEPSRERSYSTPPVVFPVAIPGCATVEPPSAGTSMAFVESAESGYDNPAYPWFSGPKAVAMSQAAQDALPGEVELAFASVARSLRFRPITDPEESGGQSGFGGWTSADAILRRGSATGNLNLSVRRSTAAVPPCVAGDLDERKHLADGIVDVDDTWYEVDGVRTLSRTAHAYLTDGTAVTATATDTDGVNHSGTVPLSLDELVAVVTAPGLRVGAPVPPGTPDVPESCNGETEGGGTIDQATARRLDAVLARIPLDGLTLDRPLGQLRPVDFGGGGVCQAVRITTPGQQSRLEVAVLTGQRLPDPSASASDGERVTSRRLPDGTVVETRESRFTTISTQPGAQPVPQLIRSVTVTRTSGARVRVGTTVDEPTPALPFERLEAIALTPGLEVR